jgi:cell division protein ZapA
MSSAPESRKQTYKVKIFNQIYSISSSASESEFEQIADQVDYLMRTIASRSGSLDGTRVGVLAAMHLADKLRQAERRLESVDAETQEIRARVDERTEHLDRLLRDALDFEDEPIDFAEGTAPAVQDFTPAAVKPRPASLPLEVDPAPRSPARNRAPRECAEDEPTLFPLTD